MLGSLEDAEDVVQETFLRAWRRRRTFEGRSTFRAWLYGIATNASLDVVASKRRRVRAPAGEGMASEVPWLQPYPDRLLPAVAPSEDEPDHALVSKETIELAFLVAIQHLPPTQRAVLIVRDPRLVGEGDRRAPRDERARRQQRAAAGAGDPEDAPAREPGRVGAKLGPERGRAGPPAATWTPPSATTSTASPR